LAGNFPDAGLFLAQSLLNSRLSFACRAMTLGRYGTFRVEWEKRKTGRWATVRFLFFQGTALIGPCGILI